MTDGEIDALEPGRKMDVLVANLIFHQDCAYHVVRNAYSSDFDKYDWRYTSTGNRVDGFSTSIQDAWQIVDRLHYYNFDLHHFDKPEGYPPHISECIIRWSVYSKIGVGDNMPEAICKAALKVVNHG